MNNEKPAILLVDDDKHFVLMVQGILTHIGGYRVLVATSFDKAIETIRKTKGLMVVFVALPLSNAGKNGFDLLEYIHKTVRYRALSYAWTSDDSRSDRIKALRSGATHVYQRRESADLDWQDLIDHIDNDVVTRLTNEATRSTVDDRTGLLRITTFDAIVEAEFKSARAENFISDSKKERAHRHPGVYTLAALDMDDFKIVNDRHGHSTGDKALAVVGKTIRESVRPNDYSCRGGLGDEFLILLSGATEVAAEAICHKLQRAIITAELVDPKGLRVSLAISYGLAILSTKAISENVKETLETLKERADENLRRMKQIKNIGR